MFLGTYKTYFSGKNRVVLPKKFRRELGGEEKFYLVLGLDGELWGFNTFQWQKEAEKRLGIPITNEEGRRLRREFFSRAEECILDSQGRFIIPKDLLEGAGIKDEVVLVGAGDHFEVWEVNRWGNRSK